MIRKIVVLKDLPLNTSGMCILHIAGTNVAECLKLAGHINEVLYTLPAARYTDLNKAVDWLMVMHKKPEIIDVVMVCDSPFISSDDVVCVARIFIHGIFIEFKDGRTENAELPQVSEVEDPFLDGMIAACDGQDESANPHPSGTEKNRLWADGVQTLVN